MANPEKVKAAAQCISRRVTSGHHVIAVVSAMGTTTNELNNLAQQVSASPSRRELDMLISAGERISMALISMALNDLGCPAISFTGSQAGVLTKGTHSDAEISDLKPIRVVDALKDNKVAVVAGFQGVDPHSKEVTTLGRGGSDITAVAFAHHFNAKHCRFIKDVPGIQPIDPKWVENDKVISQVPMRALLSSCRMGAKVLNPRCVELALNYRVPLILGPIDGDGKGSEIRADITAPMQPLFISVLPSVFEFKESMNEQVVDWQRFGLLPWALTHYEHDGNVYYVVHPDHSGFYRSKLETEGISFQPLQVTAVIFSDKPKDVTALDALNELDFYNGFVHENMWVAHWSPEADLKKCAAKIFKRMGF